MRKSDYGKKLGQAIIALTKTHLQVSQLLSDSDKLFSNYTSVFGNIVTSNLTHQMNSDFWMAEGVYRYWFRPRSNIHGLTIAFHDWEREQEQPLLIVGNIKYLGNKPKDKCEPWDLWYGAKAWGPQPLRLNKAFDVPRTGTEERIGDMKLVVVPLFNIENLNDIKDLFKKVGVNPPER